VLIGQHHQDFRDGFASLGAFVEKLQRMRPNLRWLPLGAALRASYWQRSTAYGGLETRSVLIDAVADGRWDERHYSVSHRAQIALRRYACEARDNYLHRSRSISAALTAVKGRSESA
jgi:hypothetical protein